MSSLFPLLFLCPTLLIMGKKTIPVVLSIAGSDNSAGAGIQADLKTFCAFKTYGTTALTCIVAENPDKVYSIQPVHPEVLKDQIQSIVAFYDVAALKTGMVYSTAAIKIIVTALKPLRLPLVVDPVLVSTSGSFLIQEDAAKLMQKDLFPLATLVTPNLDEASFLLGKKISNPAEAESAVKILFQKFKVPFLVKGGHLKGKIAVDYLCAGKTVQRFSAPFIPRASTHGTGCTYSAAITCGLALGFGLEKSVSLAKKFITNAIKDHLPLSPSRHALNHFLQR